jgi:hypothetical protein
VRRWQLPSPTRVGDGVIVRCWRLPSSTPWERELSCGAGDFLRPLAWELSFGAGDFLLPRRGRRWPEGQDEGNCKITVDFYPHPSGGRAVLATSFSHASR